MNMKKKPGFQIRHHVTSPFGFVVPNQHPQTQSSN